MNFKIRMIYFIVLFFFLVVDAYRNVHTIKVDARNSLSFVVCIRCASKSDIVLLIWEIDLMPPLGLLTFVFV